jgi:hypothetical protein
LAVVQREFQQTVESERLVIKPIISFFFHNTTLGLFSAEWLADFQALVSTAFSPHSINAVPYEICINGDVALRPGEIRSKVCPKKAVGRYVFVRKNNGFPLSLCEVEVYATKPRRKLELEHEAWKVYPFMIQILFIGQTDVIRPNLLNFLFYGF